MNKQISSDVPVHVYANFFPGAASVSRGENRKIVASYVPSRNTPRPVVASAPVVETEVNTPEVSPRRLAQLFEEMQQAFNCIVPGFLDANADIAQAEDHARIEMHNRVKKHIGLSPSERSACNDHVGALTYTGPLPEQAASTVEASVPWFATKVPGPHKASQPNHFHTKSATARRHLNEAFARRFLCGQNVSDQEIDRLKQAVVDAQREDAALSELTTTSE